MHILGQLIGSVDDKGQIGIAGFAQWSGYTDAHSIHLFQNRKVGRGFQPAGFHQAGDLFAGYILDVALAACDAVHLALVWVDACHVKASLCEDHRQRQTDVSQPQDGDFGAAVLELVGKRLLVCV